MNKLWLLEVIKDQGYDCADGFVVQAENEAQARVIAQENGGVEARSWGYTREESFWTRPELATCKELIPDNTGIKVILRSFNAG